MNRRTFYSLPVIAALPAWTQTVPASDDPGAPKFAIEHWKDLRCGMFIHWGPVSLAGTEIGWSRGGPFIAPDETQRPPIARKIVRHSLLTGGSAALKQSESGIEVGVAAPQRHAIDTIVTLELDGPAAGIAALRPA